ncbi:MAG: DNA polymerase III subunit beta, partial [Thermacetogeniaceae bacterium]
MKAICERQELLQALSALSRVVPSRPSSPILGGCLLFTGHEGIVLQGTDLDLSLTIRVPAEISEDGSFVVPLRHFLDLVRRLPEGGVILEWNGRGSRLEVRYREGAAVRLDVWDAEEFPSLQPRALGNGISIEGELWKNLTKKVVFSAAAREIRPNYAGIYFEAKGEDLILVSTDTYRLSVVRIPYTFEGNVEGGILVPTQAVNESVRLVGDDEQLEVTWDKRVVSFQTERFVLTTRLIDARFPAYESVIPGSSELDLYVDKDLLESCLERASLFVEPNERFA